MPAVNRFRLSGNPFERPASDVAEPKAVIFLSTEGTKTEPSYFRNLQKAIQQGHGDFPYVIHVLEHRRDTNSDPSHVLELIEECKAIREEDRLIPFTTDDPFIEDLDKKYKILRDHPESLDIAETQEIKDALTKLGIDVDYHRSLHQIGGLESSDIFGIVIDRDSQSHSRQVLEEIRSVCEKKHIVFCLSNPCFELWLLLHVLDVSALPPDEKRKLLENSVVSRNHTYASRLLSEKSQISGRVTLKSMKNTFLPNTQTALRNAKALGKTGQDVLDHLGTTVPALVAKFQPWLP